MPPSPSTAPALYLARRPLYNRIAAVMYHIPWYSVQGQNRLAQDAHISKSALCRLLTSRSVPFYPTAHAIRKALEKRLGKRLDLDELFSPDNTYPTPSVCTLVGCKGCLPDAVYDEEDRIKPQYRDVLPGQWSTIPELAAAPGGVEEEEEL